MKPKITHVLLDENDLLDLICEKHNISREKASMHVNYVEEDHNIPGSWIIQVQAPDIGGRLKSIKKGENSKNVSKSKLFI